MSKNIQNKESYTQFKKDVQKYLKLFLNVTPNQDIKTDKNGKILNWNQLDNHTKKHL